MGKNYTSLFIVLFTSLFFTCSSGDGEKSKALADKPEPLQTETIDIYKAEGIAVESYDYEHFKPFLNQKDDRIHVINFWATWCVPCVKELPYFEALTTEQPEIDVLLVSLDFSNVVEKSLIPFIQKNDLKSRVILLDDPDGNSWIPKIDEDWTGAIPATIIYKNEQMAFYERSFTAEELQTEINKFK
jgi:thiol-disulfide isomerase/thioredoxin